MFLLIIVLEYFTLGNTQVDAAQVSIMKVSIRIELTEVPSPGVQFILPYSGIDVKSEGIYN